MENKIIFLIVAILLLYALFSEKGQQIVKQIFGLVKAESNPDLTNDSKYPKYSGGTTLPDNVG